MYDDRKWRASEWSIMTGVENLYVMKNHKRLRCGYTTGSCAAGCAKAAAVMLLSGRKLSCVRIQTPNGIWLKLPLEKPEIIEDERPSIHPEMEQPGDTGDLLQEVPGEAGDVRPAAVPGNRTDDVYAGGRIRAASCAVRKDAGDDPDATDKLLIFALVQHLQPGEEAAHPHAFRKGRLLLDGGEGVGRVTLPGLKQKPGESAINPVPQKMILNAVESVCEEYGFDGPLLITISVPEGAAAASKTFNPRLGIEGGISILGTTGIVEPMSEDALIASIQLEMSVLVKGGRKILLVTPGNYGETFAEESMHIDPSRGVMCSNYVGETVDEAVKLGADGLLFVAHAGKFIKVAGGIMNTHSKNADCRAQLCAAFALQAGIRREDALQILETNTTDEALNIMDRAGVRDKAMELACEQIRYHLQKRAEGALKTEAVIFNTVFGLLGMTKGAGELIEALQKG